MNTHSLQTKPVAASRRSFLKSGVGLGAAAALPSFTMRAADEQKKWPDNPFLQGNGAPVHEEITADNLKIIGKLPADLEGSLFGTGRICSFRQSKTITCSRAMACSMVCVCAMARRVIATAESARRCGRRKTRPTRRSTQVFLTRSTSHFLQSKVSRARARFRIVPTQR